ncbi:hypothetical protein DMA11_05530 [Marinilabiliaceae bacterium JC017]|nr:hypothetical protein DMA11_05530 [Marinilabiliaceae bacterium JC017]
MGTSKPFLFRQTFKEDANWGEQEVIRFRWILISVILIFIVYIYYSGNPQRAFVSMILAGFYLLYNSILNFLIKQFNSATWIRFLSATIDISVLSAHVFNYSYFFKPIAITTAASTFLYPLLIMLSVLRYDGRLVIFSTIYSIFCFNLIYYLRLPEIDPNLISQVASVDWAGQIYKSSYFALMGYFLFSIPKMIDRLGQRQNIIINQRREASFKLELERQKNELTSHQLEQEKKLNQQLSSQKEIIKEQKDRLQEVNSTKDKLFSIIGHDLRTPFSAQYGITNIMLDELNNFSKAEIRDAIHSINKSAQQGLDLLSNLLEWAHSQNNLFAHQAIPIKIEPLITETLSLLQNNYQHKKQQITIKTVPYITISANSNMLKTILRNLISNAIKFTPDNGEITIETSQSNDTVTLSVSDNGVGINSEKVKNLFNIQKNSSTPGTNNEPGTGLGLILCKDLAEKQGGSIMVRSIYGKGSTFTVILPAFTIDTSN